MVILLFFCSNFFPETGLAQYSEKALVYELFRGTDKIGTVVCIQVTDGAKDIYRIETHVDVKVVFNVKADIVVKNTFMNGVLTEAFAKRIVNGNVKTNNSIIQQENAYRMVNKDLDTSFYSGPIRQCVSQLYFGEPVNLTTVFSETFLQQVLVKMSSAGTYQLSLPDGRTNYYTYEKGVCTAVIIETQLSTVHLKLASAVDD